MRIGLRAPAILLAVALAGVIGPAHAGSKVSEVGPQWLQRFSREVFADDTIGSPDGPTWTRLPNGEIVLFTATVDGDYDAALLARRFAPDGMLLQSRLLPFSEIGAFAYQRIVVKYDPATSDIVVLTGLASPPSYTYPCALLRFDAGLEPKSSTLLGSEEPGDKACIELQLLADGSAIVADNAGLSRIGTDGALLWSVRNRDENRYLQPRDMLVDDAGVIWVASKGSLVDDSSRVAAVLRYDVQGTFLSGDYYRCKICVANSAEGLEQLANGDVVAVGTFEGGSGENRFGFFARYGADGQRELLIDTELYVGYLDVASDQDGALYVFAKKFPQSEVRRIDPDSGAVSWAVPAQDFVAAAHGIVVRRSEAPGISVHGYDAAGTSLWDRVLVTEPGSVVSRGQRVDDRVEFLLQTHIAEPDCGLAPLLLSLDASGDETVLARPCLMPSSTFLNSVDALPGVGVLVAAWNQLAAYAPDGELRWSALTCEWCVDSGWERAVLTPDGGAWAIEYSWQGGGYGLKRLDSEGFVLLSVSVTFDSGPYSLFATNERAIIVQGDWHTVKWQRIDLDSGVLETRSHVLPGGTFQFEFARLLADGGVTAALGPTSCDLTCPPFPHTYIVVKLAADGSLEWWTPQGVGFVGLDGAGGANVIASNDPDSLQLRRVTPDGDVLPDIALPTEIRNPRGVYGPHAGRLLLVWYNDPDYTTFTSLDLDGNVLANRDLSRSTMVLDDSPLGLLATTEPFNATSAQWIDPVSLETRARFRFAVAGATDESTHFYPDSWHLLADGSVYGADAHFNAWRLTEPRLARFSSPGFVPTELIYRNGFD